MARCLIALLAIFVLTTGIMTTIPVPTAHAAALSPTPGRPNTYHPEKAATKGTPPQPAPTISGPPTAGPQHRHSFTPTMKPMKLALSPTASATAMSSDGRFAVDVPAGAISAADVAAAGGPIQLVVTQVAPPSGSTTGGHISLGIYLLQLQNPAGKELPSGVGLHKNVSLHYFWKGKHAPVSLDRFIAVINGASPVDLGMPVAHLGKHQSFFTAFDKTTTSITAVVPLAASSSTAAFDTASPEGFFGKADIFQNDLHTGTLANSIDFDLPKGPGNLTPPLHLSYSSGAVNANTNAQAAGPWVGEGWSLDLGSITWSEYNTTSNSTTATWENAWSISDPFGASSELIPPNINVSTFFDDTPNPVPSGAPITWHTSPEMHAKIISYTNPHVDCTNFPQSNVCGSGNYAVQPPCWRVWLPNGVMEEYGCTPDSLQWYPGGSSGTTNYPSVWKLDMLTDPNGNQVHVIYKRDMSAANGNSYVRDIVMDHIEYDAPACHNANTMCTGTSWNPRVKIVFSSSNSVAHPYPGRPSCAANGALRCDDPAPETSPNIGTPLITSTQVLNDMQVQVYNNSTWNTLHSYKFQYEQGPAAGTIADPITGNVESVNGFLLLDQFQEFGTNGTTAYPPQTFKYANPDGEWYEDSAYHPASGTPCGPSWNTGNKPSGNTGCVLWWENFNIFYLSEVDNGQGAVQTFTWLDMRTNQHGVDAGQNALDPSYCTVHQSGNYPCDLADDNGWSHISLTSRTVTVKSPTSSNANQTTTSTWNYKYNLSNLVAQECSDCKVGFYWGNANNGDYLDFYEGKFMGYAFAQVVNPDNSAESDYFYATDGWGVYDNTQVGCFDGQSVCPNAPYWHTNNAASGRPYQVDKFDVQSGGTYPLLQRVLTTYTVTCPPSGVSGSGGTYKVGWGDFNGNLVEELNHNNPVASCDVQVGSVKTYYANGVNSPSDTTVPMTQTSNTYNKYGQLLTSVTTGNDLSTTSSTTKSTDYIYNDNIATSNTSATGTYIVDTAADSFVKDASNNVVSCSYAHFDGMAYATGQNSGLTRGLLTANDAYANCAAKTGGSTTSTTYNSNGNPVGSIDPDGNAGTTSHKASAGPCIGLTSCSAYDATFGTLPISQGNALNQNLTINYTATQAFGYGLWPSSTVDTNGQTSSTAYDALGRVTSTTIPGETAANTTQTQYVVSCPTTGASAPCLEVDPTWRLDNTTTVTEHDFYDGWGHHVETRTAAPGGQDVVQYAMYDTSGRMNFLSQPYYVATGTGYSIPDTTQPGTTYTFNGLGAVTSTTDPVSSKSTVAYTTVCNVAGTSDSACYSATTTIDANGHQSATYTDALQRSRYGQQWTGVSGSFVLYSTYKTQYDYLGNVSQTTYADGTHSSAATYNGLDEQTTSTNPDLGTYTFTYDPSGNLLSSADPRGASGTVYQGYDGLNRVQWKSMHSDGSSPLATYTYDETANGNKGIGRLTSETFASGPNQSITGSYAFTYDGRGEKTNWSMTIGGTSYPFALAYNDAGQLTTLTYPDGDVVTQTYGAQGWLSGATETLGANTVTLLGSMNYAGRAGAAGLVTAFSVGNSMYSWSATYDNALRQQEIKAQLASNSTVLYDQSRTFDSVGNVTTTSTTVPAGTDNQRFCYDSLNRVTWAGAAGTPPSGCGTLTAGTLTSAQYTATYAFDILDRLTTGPQGAGYTYGDANHLDAVTSANGFTAAYDAAGNMTCRAPTSSQTCSGTPTGQSMSYDGLLRMLAWQDSVTNPSQTASYAYNGDGERVWQQVTSSGTTTTTTYVGTYEEVTTTGSSTTTTKYYAAGPVSALRVNGTLSYLANDGLGTVSVALDANGNVTATQLFTPYGTTRYSTGTMPTSYGFTGQRQDPSGLTYMHARYYDPALGQFASADTSADGLNRYVYVGGNPTSRSDPTGHVFACVAGLLHSAQTGGDWGASIGGCVADVTLGARAAVQAKAASNVLDVALQQFKSGNYKYLTNEGGADLTRNLSTNVLADASVSGLRDLRTIIPGWGPEPVDGVLDTVKNVLNTAGDVRATGVGGGKLNVGELSGELEAAENGVKGLRTLGRVAGVVGIVFTGAVAGFSDYQEHGDVGRAIAVGAFHAGASAVGAWVGGALGGAIGSAICPGVGTVIGSFIGASFGGWAGDQIADQVVKFNDSGAAQNIADNVTSNLADLGNSASNAWTNVTNFFGM